MESLGVTSKEARGCYKSRSLLLQVKGDKGDKSLMLIHRFLLMVLGQSIIKVEAGNKEVDRLRSRRARRDRRKEKRSGVDLKEYE